MPHGWPGLSAGDSESGGGDSDSESESESLFGSLPATALVLPVCQWQPLYFVVVISSLDPGPRRACGATGQWGLLLRDLGSALREFGMSAELMQMLREQREQNTEMLGQMRTQGKQLRDLSSQLQAQGAQLQAQGAQLLEMKEQLLEVKEQLLELKGGRALQTLGERAAAPLPAAASSDAPAPARRALAAAARAAGGGGGGSGGGSGADGASNGSSPPSPVVAVGQASPAGSARLRAAFAAAPPPAPALAIALGTDSRALPALVQVALLAHRLRTPTRVQDFDYVPVNFAESTVLPDARKGFSVFLVASLDAEVGRLAHELRSAASRGNLGCISLPLASLPASLVLTIDGVLEREGGGGGGAPIVWHATVSPAAPMLFSAFEAAFCGWAGALPCRVKAGGERPEEASGDEGEALDLTCLSARSAAYAASKLAAHAAALRC